MAIDRDLRRQITGAIVLAALIAAVVGVVVALTATAALRTVGISGGDGPAPSVAQPEPDETPTPDTVESPSSTPSPSTDPTPSTSPGPSTSPSPTSGPRSGAGGSREPKPDAESSPIELHTGALAAVAMEQVTLRGRYPGGNGTTLQVQRLEGGSWTAFPTTATVEGGTFQTYVALGRPGPNRLRVVDPATGETSNVVRIRVFGRA
ncbi:MAG TPA: hypothetical protein VFJ14_09660 [Nocardioidaceae bacterium]|nr:hypothetical protein [Nocardioidaceae bacterium]